MARPKPTLLLLGILCASLSMRAQIDYTDYQQLTALIKTEQWSQAWERSTKMLKKSKRDTSDMRAQVLYMHLISGAGMIIIDGLTYEEMEKETKKYLGQRVLMPAHPLAKNESMTINQTVFSETDSTHEAFTTMTNDQGFNILSFEKFYFNQKPDVGDIGEDFLRCGGRLKAIEFNPNHSKVWIMRLSVSDAYFTRIVIQKPKE